MSKVNSIAFTLIIVALLAWYIYGHTFGLVTIKNSCKTEKAISFNKKVKNIIQDSINPPLKEIVFTDGSRYKSIYTYGLWMSINKGDSIVKKSNTLQYLIYRYSEAIQVDTFYTDEDCDKIENKLY